MEYPLNQTQRGQLRDKALTIIMEAYKVRRVLSSSEYEAIRDTIYMGEYFEDIALADRP